MFVITIQVHKYINVTNIMVELASEVLNQLPNTYLGIATYVEIHFSTILNQL